MKHEMKIKDRIIIMNRKFDFYFFFIFGLELLILMWVMLK